MKKRLLKEKQKSIYKRLLSVKNFNYSDFKLQFKDLLKYPKLLGKPSDCFSIRFEKYDSLIAASYSNGNIVIYNTETRDHLKYFQASDFPVTCIRWKPHSEDKPKNL